MRLLFILAVAIATVSSAPAYAAACAGFTDVDSANTTYCSAVTYLKDKGITLGCGDGSNYCPNDYVTRLQMALFLQRAGRGGPNNVLGDSTTTIGGGDHNTSTGGYSTVGGGAYNIAGGIGSTVSGGSSNIADGYGSTVSGGTSNAASGFFSFAAGHDANAVADGEFVWADDIGEVFEPSAAGSTPGWADARNTFNVRATGGVWFVTGVASGQPATGPYVVAGSGAWSATSDRAVKENFRAIDPRDVLAKVSAMPITTWNYITEGAQSRHLGPVSQDFHSAFLLGSDDKSITSIDETGVALAAIQGLNAKLESENRAKDSRIDALEQRLAKLESALPR